jgi:tetratricopeptide (TPR) repeat protein
MQLNRLQQLLDMLKEQPKDPFLIYATGVEYEALGDISKARLFFDELLTSHPEYLPTYYKYGVILALHGETDRAKDLLQKGIELARSQGEMKTLREMETALENVEEE